MGGTRQYLNGYWYAICYLLINLIPFDNIELHFSHILLHFSGNTVALLHSLFSNLPQEWLEGAHVIIKHLRPITSVAMLRIVFRIMGPLLPKLANAHSLFCKVG